MPLPLVNDNQPEDFWAKHGQEEAPNSAFDSTKAKLQLSNVSGLTAAMVDAYNISDIEKQYPSQKMLSVDELNQRYNGLGKTWKQPTGEMTAAYIARAEMQKSSMANRIARGDGGWLGSIGRGGASVYSFFGGTDPASILAGAATGGAFRASGILAGEGLGQALARGAGEGLAVTVPQEAAMVAHEKQMQEDVSVEGHLFNIGLGSLIGAGIEGGLHAYNAKGGRTNQQIPPKELPPGSPPPPPPPVSPPQPEMVPHPEYGPQELHGPPTHPEILGSGSRPEHNSTLVDVATRQLEEGFKPNVEPLIKLHEDERQAGGPRPKSDPYGKLSYDYKPIDTNQPVSGTFFHGNNSKNENFQNLNFADNPNSHDYFGNGVTGNDNAIKANGHAEGGLVHAFQIDGAKLLPVDKADPALLAPVAKALRSPEFNMPKFAEEVEDGKATARDIYANLTDFGKDKMNETLAKEGYKGLHFEDAKSDGSNKSNGVMLFDKADATPRAAYTPDTSLLPKLTDEAKTELTNADNKPERELGYNPEEEKAIKQATDAAEVKKFDETDAQADNAAAKAKIKAMMENNLLAPEQIKQVEEIKAAMDERAAESKNIIQSMFDCIAGHN